MSNFIWKEFINFYFYEISIKRKIALEEFHFYKKKLKKSENNFDHFNFQTKTLKNIFSSFYFKNDIYFYLNKSFKIDYQGNSS